MKKFDIENWAEEFFVEHGSYRTQITNFINFLKNPNINRIGHAAFLTKTDIELFIGQSPQINSVNTMESYLEALKTFFDYLYKKGHNDAYVVPRGKMFTDFKRELTETYALRAPIERDFLDGCEVKTILDAIDKYFEETIYENLSPEGKERYIYRLCLRVYIKISLLAPAKKSVLMNLTFHDFDSDFRAVKINSVVINVPNGLRHNIKDSLEFIYKTSSTHHSLTDRFFEYYTTSVKSQKDSFGTALNAKFCKFLQENNLLNIESSRTSYPLEILSNSAIAQMVKHATNPIYISQITGLTIGQIANKYYSKLSGTSYEITAESDLNRSIACSEYYHYF